MAGVKKGGYVLPYLATTPHEEHTPLLCGAIYMGKWGGRILLLQHTIRAFIVSMREGVKGVEYSSIYEEGEREKTK